MSGKYGKEPNSFTSVSLSDTSVYPSSAIEFFYSLYPSYFFIHPIW